MEGVHTPPFCLHPAHMKCWTKVWFSCFGLLTTLSCLLQVPENAAADGMANSIVMAWKEYGNHELVC